jgi:phosphoesterase RecJ-like protein
VSGPIDEDIWARAVSALRDSSSVVVLGHVAPDGDALGSALAVGMALSKLSGSRSVAVSFGDDPFVVPANLAGLPGLDLLVPPAAIPAGADVVVTCDASSPDRLGGLRDLAEAAPTLIVLDHHVSYTGFGTLSLVDPKAPATAVVADELIRRLNVSLTADIAAALYAGLVTDTGSFRYAGTTPDTLQMGARLLATGIRFDVLARQLFDNAPFSYLGVLGRALDRAVFDADAVGGLGMVWTVVPALDRSRAGLPLDHVEGIIDVVRKAEEAEIACVVKEDDDGAFRVSMRSKGRVDVSAVAGGFGGGGHRFAAGFTSASDLGGTLDALRSALGEAPHTVA